MATQTVRYAKVRVRQDPDRENDVFSPENIGMYFGSNMTTHGLNPGWTRRVKNTRGSCG